MTLILSGQDTLESRRAQLTERFFLRSVLLALSAAGRTRFISDRPSALC